LATLQNNKKIPQNLTKYNFQDRKFTIVTNLLRKDDNYKS